MMGFSTAEAILQPTFENRSKEILVVVFCGYSETQKKRLAYRSRKLNEFLLATVEQTFAPGTIRVGRTSLPSSQ